MKLWQVDQQLQALEKVTLVGVGHPLEPLVKARRKLARKARRKDKSRLKARRGWA